MLGNQQLTGSLQHLKPETVQFSEDSLRVLNFALSFIMFGIALGMDKNDFRKVRQFPKSVAVGLASQFVLLPLLTFLMILILKPGIYISLGMLLVAACPGGNMSNFITYLSRGNVVLSIALTSVATLLALVMTPLNFSMYSQWVVNHAHENPHLSLSAWDMMQSIATLIILPLIAGLTFKEYLPALAQKLERPFKILSLVVFFSFIVIALANNFNVLKQQSVYILLVIVLHNGVAFAGGYGISKLFRLSEHDSRTISIETGIQNSGLGLVLIFTYFNGNPDMALIAAGWGIWHIVAGYILSLFWRRSNV